MYIKPIEANCIAKTDSNCYTNEIKVIFNHASDEDVTTFSGSRGKQSLKNKEPFNKFVDASTQVSRIM